MYTRKTLPLRRILLWTRWHLALFTALAFVPVALYDILGCKWLHVPWLPISLVGTAVAFIVGFKNNASYDRMWEARKIWGGIVNASRSFTVMVKDFVRHDDIPGDKLLDLHRELVYRHVGWLTALRYQLRTVRPWENKRASPGNRRFHGMPFRLHESEIPMECAVAKYIPTDELGEIFSKANQATQILGIQSRRLRELRKAGLLGAYEHVEIERMVVELYALQGKSERIKNFPYPRQFATLNYVFVWLFILLLPYGVMEEFERVGDHIIAEHLSDNASTGALDAFVQFAGSRFVWLTIPFSAVITWVFYALEIVGELSENPFEGGPNDVPITDLSRSIEIDICQLVDCTDIPEKILWESGVVL
ncbi:bestrophin family protein [Botrimarina mediterranea]|uniref:Bestrophin, RFP-TM, chloride channel n=1 Tax=Botrimarina mediterranea TaxID=2528022 RepID=A0A518K7D9_9BACT|nr:bestrophin family ion channel [Botrimarina mediterranea]QDV73705.1 Bestrophin, RFP-TM, chloride channel [Botrimarina mediterranea]